MKFLKLSIFAIALGFFASSCGDKNNTTDDNMTDTSTIVEPVPPANPTEDFQADSTIHPVDTMPGATTPVE